jgi:ribosomal protein L7/L12
MPAAYQASDLQRKFGEVSDRFRALEEAVAQIAAATGVAYQPPGADVPDEVVQLAQAGKALDAVKLYRQLTGADFEAARAVVSGL